MTKTPEEIQQIKDAFSTEKYFYFTVDKTACKWAHIQKPDDKFGEPIYKIDLMLSKEQAEDMKAIGFNVRTNKDGEVFITAKMKAKYPDGSYRDKPVVEIEDGTPWTEPVGNGSVVTVHCSSKFVTVAGKTHLPLYFNRVTIHSLVTYTTSVPGGTGGGVGKIQF